MLPLPSPPLALHQLWASLPHGPCLSLPHPVGDSLIYDALTHDDMEVKDGLSLQVCTYSILDVLASYTSSGL